MIFGVRDKSEVKAQVEWLGAFFASGYGLFLMEIIGGWSMRSILKMSMRRLQGNSYLFGAFLFLAF